MIYNYIWEQCDGNLDEYLIRVDSTYSDFYGDSVVCDLHSLAEDLPLIERSGYIDNLNKTYNRDEDLELYSIGGIGVENIHITKEDKEDIKLYVKSIKKLINSC